MEHRWVRAADYDGLLDSEPDMVHMCAMGSSYSAVVVLAVFASGS